MSDWMKVFKTGLLAGAAMLVVGLLLNAVWGMLFPSVSAEYMNGFFRPWTDWRMSLIFVHPFVLGIALAYLYEITKAAFKHKDAVQRGMQFGFTVWAVASIPGMLISYSSFFVSEAMIFTWLANGLLQLLFGGAVLAKTWGR